MTDLDAIRERHPHTRIVLVAEEAADMFFGRDDQGNRLTFDWHEPDEHGCYEPTITAHYDDNIVAPYIARVAELEAALRDEMELTHPAFSTRGDCICVVHEKARALLARPEPKP